MFTVTRIPLVSRPRVEISHRDSTACYIWVVGYVTHAGRKWTPLSRMRVR